MSGPRNVVVAMSGGPTPVIMANLNVSELSNQEFIVQAVNSTRTLLAEQ